jgi:Penicillin-insensitive murein endopeptidase
VTATLTRHWPYAIVAAGLAVLGIALALALGGGSSSAPAPALAGAAPAGTPPAPGTLVPPPPEVVGAAHVPSVHWRHSVAEGQPWHGRLRDGVELPAYGRDFVTWDPVLYRYPNRADRRWGTARLIKTLLYVLYRYHRRHPQAPPVLVADIARPRGGWFGSRYGGLGHASHQNGLDVDVLYPRKDGNVLPAGPPDMDRRLSQDLVDLFVKAYAQYVFVGPHTGLHGPRGVVQALVNHDDHMHVRIYPR